MKDMFSLEGDDDEERVAISFKEKIEEIGREVVRDYNMICSGTLTNIFFTNYGWDKYKIRYAVKLLHSMNYLIDVGWAQTWAVNKGYGRGRQIICTRDRAAIKILPTGVELIILDPSMPKKTGQTTL